MKRSLNIENSNLMKSNIFTQLGFVLIAGSILAACSATSNDDKAKKLDELKKQQADIAKQILSLEKEMPVDSAKAKAAKSKEVAVTSVASRSFDHYIQTQGKVDAEENVLVSAKSLGLVTNVFVKEGQQVSKGQILAQLDNAMVLRNIEGMKAQVNLANTVYQRQKNLWDQKIGTEVQYLQAKTNKENLEQQLAAMEEQNDMTRIRAPFAGTIDDVAVKVGENTAPGFPAFRVVNTSKLKLQANVSEAFVTQIKAGNKATITIPELKKNVSARVTFVGRNIDPLSRTFPVEVSLPSEANLRPNMTGVVKIIYLTEPNAIVVPINVVQTLNETKVVYVAETTGTQTIARKKVVTVLGVFGSDAQVTGLNEGDKVITVGFQGLNDGDFVKI
jgi:membrane fusion protein (multidrug efflux system)